MFGKTSDQQLIEKALHGSQSCWETLVKRYERRVYNHCLRMAQSEADALDLMQDVFLSVYRNLPNFRFDASFSTWLFRISSNRCLDWLRARKRNPLGSADEFDETHFSNGRTAQDDVSAYQQNRAIQAALQTLPEDQRIVVELKFFQHFTFEEIAEQLQVSPNTVKTRLYTALRKIRTCEELRHAS